ncbi:MAG: hypothetical protein ACXVI3_02970 [Halobacteriota archaeon]
MQRDAADALGKIGDPRAIGPLGNKISDNDVETRAVATRVTRRRRRERGRCCRTSRPTITTRRPYGTRTGSY